MPVNSGRLPKKARKAIGLLALLILFITGCAGNRDSWGRIQEAGVLRVGVDPTFPPFALAEGDAVEGIDVDLAKSLSDDLGLEVQFSYFGYDGLYDALTTGQVDALISALVIMPERTKEIAYSDAYFDAGQFLVAPESSEIRTMADMNGRTLAVELGALGHVAALDWERRLEGLEIQTYGSVGDALTAVASGNADAALVDRVGGLLYLKDPANHADGLAMSAEPVAPEPYAIAVRIDDRILMEKINGALAKLRKSGQLDVIIERWVNE